MKTDSFSKEYDQLNITQKTSFLLGLDPAGPLFEGYDPKVRLDETDADYVDVVHSNGEPLIVGGFGISEPIGHVDFYPNGGRAQRGCQHLLIGGLYDFIYCKATPRAFVCAFTCVIFSFPCSLQQQRQQRHLSLSVQPSASLQTLHQLNFSEMQG